MRTNLRRLAVLFSVVLNVAFLGTYAYRDAGRWLPHRNSPHPLPYEALQLTPAQQRAFEPLRNEFHSRLRQVGEELKGEQLRLLDLLAAPQPDAGAIRASQTKVQELQGSIQDAVIAHLTEQNRIFTPAQRARFFQILRERMSGADVGSPPWAGAKATGTSICPFPADGN